MKNLKTIQEKAVEEFHKKYDFSEQETLEYDNLIGIADFLTQAISDSFNKGVEEAEKMIKMEIPLEVPPNKDDSYESLNAQFQAIKENNNIKSRNLLKSDLLSKLSQLKDKK